MTKVAKPGPLLAVDGLGFRFPGRNLLHGIAFEARPGECIALLGANGAGKSTLLDLIAGLREPAAGTIEIAGRSRAKLAGRELAQAIGHLPQAVHADLPFTAEQLVAMGRYPHTDRWFESPADHRHIEQAMRRTGSWSLRRRAFASLSGGERQRVLLAACLAQDARILLLDEPSTFLDIAAQLECFELLRAEARAGKLAIAVTHDLNLALTFCTRLLVLEAGCIAHDLRIDQAAADPAWLQVFSPSLRLAQAASGTPWVTYT